MVAGSRKRSYQTMVKPEEKMMAQTAAIPIKISGSHQHHHQQYHHQHQNGHVSEEEESMDQNGFDVEPRVSEARRSSFLRVNDGILLGTSVPDYVDHQVDFSCVPPPKVPRSAKTWEVIAPSKHAMETVNPIRRIVDVMSIKPNPDKTLIKLHLGDPTLTGTLPTHENVLKSLETSLRSGKYNGYGPAVGVPEVRAAVAEKYSTPEAQLTAEDIVLTSGCSHALQLAIEALANPGDNILVPRPGFPLYSTLMRPHGIEDRQYNLLMHQNWEADLAHMESLIDDRTRVIIVNNPSNPCGAVYSKKHLEGILQLADRYKIPIIADEIYGNMAFGGAQFIPMATLEPKVPILTCDGIAKRYLVPGWRLGWLIIHDRYEAFAEVRAGLRQLAQKIVGPSAVVQGALPSILKETPPEFFQHTCEVLERNAQVAEEAFVGVPGIHPVTPNGAMYMMVGLDMKSFPDFDDELEFTKALIAEESVYCLPGSAFHYPGAIRLVMTYNAEIMREACERIAEFCRRHYRSPKERSAEEGHKMSIPNIHLPDQQMVYELLGDDDKPFIITPTPPRHS